MYRQSEDLTIILFNYFLKNPTTLSYYTKVKIIQITHTEKEKKDEYLNTIYNLIYDESHLEIFSCPLSIHEGGYIDLTQFEKGKIIVYPPAPVILRISNTNPRGVYTHRLLKSLATRLNRVIRLHWATLVSSFNYNLDGSARSIHA